MVGRGAPSGLLPPSQGLGRALLDRGVGTSSWGLSHGGARRACGLVCVRINRHSQEPWWLCVARTFPEKSRGS